MAKTKDKAAPAPKASPKKGEAYYQGKFAQDYQELVAKAATHGIVITPIVEYSAYGMAPKVQVRPMTAEEKLEVMQASKQAEQEDA